MELTQELLEWKLAKFLERQEVIEKRMYIQKFIPMVMACFKMNCTQAVNYIDKYDGELFDCVLYPQTVQIRINILSGNKDERWKIQPYLEEPKVNNLIRVRRKCYAGFKSQDVIRKLQGVRLRLNKQVFTQGSNAEEPVHRNVQELWLDKPFYTKWFLDNRGRMYSEGYGINIQGDEYKRELMELAEPVKLNDAGIMELYIQIGSKLLPSTSTFEERYAAGLAYKEESNDLTILKCRESLANGWTHQLVGVDASSSNIQIMSALVGCKQGMLLTNLTGSANCKVYLHVMELMNKTLSKENQIMDADIKPIMKPALMTHYFNSSATPRESFKTPQLHAFYRAVDQLLPGAERVMRLCNTAWSDKQAFIWTMPDGHVVHIKRFITKTEQHSIEGRWFNFDYKVQGCDNNYRHLAANVIHSIDAWIAREIVRRSNQVVIPIHDNFLTHPNNIERVKTLYREILCEAVEMDLLARILNQISGKEFPLMNQEEKLDTQLSIINSVHALN